MACIVGTNMLPRAAREPPSRKVRCSDSPASCTKSFLPKGGPSSSKITSRPASASSFATTAPPGPEPTTSTSHEARMSPS